MPKKDRRSYAQRADSLKKAVIKRRKKIREMAVAHKGGQCQLCGYDRCLAALEFHHPDPAKKDFSISADGSTRSWTRVRQEIEKCVLLCANCHREVHMGITQLSRVIEIET
jgi:predicted HNH restriction endonuclease